MFDPSHSHHLPPGTFERHLPLSRIECEPLVGVGIVMGAHLTTTSGWFINRPRHAWHYSCQALQGAFRMSFETPQGAVVEQLEPDSPAWLAPRNIPYRLEAIGVGAHKLLWWALNPNFWTVPGNPFSWPPREGWLARSLAALIDERDSEDDSAARARQGFSLVAASEIERALGAFGAKRHAGLDARLRRVLSAIARSPHHPWTLRELAEIADCSPGHLSRRFRESGLAAPLEEVRRQRLTRAAGLLANPDLTLEDVAQRTGYESPFSLSRAFKNAYGCSPDHYRRQRLG